MAISHATCTHPRTPAGRRACRAGRTADDSTMARSFAASIATQPERTGVTTPAGVVNVGDRVEVMFSGDRYYSDVVVTGISVRRGKDILHVRDGKHDRTCSASDVDRIMRPEVPAAERNRRLADLAAKLDRAGNDTPRRTAKKAVKPARIQPRRSGARVAIDASGCVQAALHIDAHGGRCACGWVANKVA